MKIFNNFLICLFLVVICRNYSSAQTPAIFNEQRSSLDIVSSAGETFKNNTIQIDWTIGESFNTTIQNQSQQITQGFHQANNFVDNDNDG